MHPGLTESNIVELMRKVQEGEEEYMNDPLYMPEGETCYVFCCGDDQSKKRDWRADGYRWRHNGIKRKQIEDKFVRKTYYHVYTAPGKISGEFQRIAYECNDYHNIVVVLYKGNSSVAGSFPHGNRRRDAKPHSMTRPSVLSACRKAVGDASAVYDRLVARASVDSSLYPLAIPRDRTQVINSQKMEKKRQQKLLQVIDNMRDIKGNASFASELTTKPHFLIVFHNEEMVKHFNHLLDNTTAAEEVILTVISLWKFKEFNVSAMTYINSDFPNSEIPILFFLHHNATCVSIDMLWNIACAKISKLHKGKHASLSYASSGSSTLHLSENQYVLFSSVVDKLTKWERNPLLASSKLRGIAKNQYDMSLVFASKISEDKIDYTNPHQFDAFNDCGFNSIGDNPLAKQAAKDIDCDENWSTEVSGSPTSVQNKLSKNLLQQARSVKPSDISHCLEKRCFIVKDGQDSHEVNVFPKQRCSCSDAFYCKHIVACKISLGMLEISNDPCALEHKKLQKNKASSPVATSESSKEYDITLELTSDYLDDGIMGISEEVTIANETM